MTITNHAYATIDTNLKSAKTFRAIYESNITDCPDNFIMQLAFTHRASIMLTTDGRLFSWGQSTALGRDLEDNED